MTKPKLGNIRLKRVMGFNNSVSLGITLPMRFVRALNLKPGMLVACELKDNDKSVTVKGLNIG